MRLRNIINLLLIWLILSLIGCAGTGVKGKLMGDDQLVKASAGSTKFKGDDQFVKAEQNVKTDEISAIKKAVADLKGQVSAQMGFINKTVSDMRETSSGRDSIMNDPTMINKFILVFGIVIGVPFLGLLLVMAIYIWVSQINYGRIIKAIHNDPNMVMKDKKGEKDGNSN